MARKNRVTVPDGIYHVTARVANRAMLFASEEVKGQIFEWICGVADFSGVELYGFCIMDNHIHLLVHVPRVPERYWLDPNSEPASYAFGMRPPECRVPRWSPTGDSPSLLPGDSPSFARPPLEFMLSDEEMLSRLASLYNPKAAAEIARSWRELRRRGRGEAVDEAKRRYCRRMYNLSQFVKTLAERVAMRYNEKHGHEGCLWQGRFYSSLIQNDPRVLAIVASYIDYNPVKAKLVSRPEQWVWSSFSQACGDGPGSARARRMYEKMLKCDWSEAKARLQAIFNDKLPDNIDEEMLESFIQSPRGKTDVYAATGSEGTSADDSQTPREGESGDDKTNETSENPSGICLRASQLIHAHAWIFRRGGYLGLNRLFGRTVLAQLPKFFPHIGFGSLGTCEKLSWSLPAAA